MGGCTTPLILYQILTGSRTPAIETDKWADATTHGLSMDKDECVDVLVTPECLLASCVGE